MAVTVRILRRYGADPSVVDHNGFSPSHYAMHCPPALGLIQQKLAQGSGGGGDPSGNRLPCKKCGKVAKPMRCTGCRLVRGAAQDVHATRWTMSWCTGQHASGNNAAGSHTE